VVTPKEKPSFSFMIGLFVLAVLFGLWWFTGRRNLNELTSSTESVLTTSRETATEVVPTLAPIALPSISELGAFLQTGSAELPKSFRFDNLSFNAGTLTLAEAAGFELDQVASWLNEFPNTLIRIEGHSDSLGSESKNLDLSSKQASVIKEALIARGINGDRIETLGMGSLLPLATNSTEAGRAQNRRIELVVKRIQ
jgi:outer membrane protein OmpA-like peptidoglycan-associated protein